MDRKVAVDSAECRAVCKYISCWNQIEIRTYRGLNIFYKFSKSTDTPHKIKIPLTIQPPKELTEEPVTLGDHLRRRRLELGLFQKDVAVRIGVAASTIWNWEHGWTIDLRCMPRVIKFLGYNPIPCPNDLMKRLAWYKQVYGLSLEQLGGEMRRDPEQLADWLTGRHKPCRKNQEKIRLFLSDHVQGSAGDRIIGIN